MDQEGWLFFHYRKGGGLRRNGDFVNPASIEKVVAENPQVSDVYVYGVPAASGAPGEKDIVAAIVTSNPNDFDTALLYAKFRENLDANSVPSYIQIVDEIPKTASEKPQERFLIELFDIQSERVFSYQKPAKNS
jgi:crotonobetaine/carnitine-CoA ligase